MFKLNGRRKIILTLVLASLCGGFAPRFVRACETVAPGHTKPQDASQAKLVGTWDGTLDAGVAKLTLVLQVNFLGGVFGATLDSPDQGATNLAIDKISLSGQRVQFSMTALGADYDGKLTDNGEIAGTWKQQGQQFPLTFKRRTGDAPESALKLTSVEVEGHKINMLIGGKGSPAVIFEGGSGGGIASWSTVQSEIAKSAMSVSYDRAGLGQSQPGPKPRSAKQIAAELHLALEKAGVKPPYILVGHSLGGIFVRVFADTFPKDVVGLVLVDPSQEAYSEWLRKNRPAPTGVERVKEPTGMMAEEAALSESLVQARMAKIPSGIAVTLLTSNRDDDKPEERRVWSEKQKSGWPLFPARDILSLRRAATSSRPRNLSW